MQIWLVVVVDLNGRVGFDFNVFIWSTPSNSQNQRWYRKEIEDETNTRRTFHMKNLKLEVIAHI